MARKKAEPEKQTAPDKKTKAKTKAQPKPEYKWNDGKPERPGLYNARVNGREIPLQFKVCQFSHRSYWLYVDGSDVDPNAKVEWRSGKIQL